MKPGFHFSGKTLGYDLNHIKIVAGLEVKFKGTPILCTQGLHSSSSILDALKYARGFMLSTTETSGEIIEENDKFVGQKRKHIQVIDSQKWIILFTHWCVRRAKKYAAYAAASAADAASADADAAYAADAFATTSAYAATTSAYAAADAAYAAYAAADAAAAFATTSAYAAAAVAYAADAEQKLQHKVLNAYMRKAGLRF